MGTLRNTGGQGPKLEEVGTLCLKRSQLTDFELEESPFIAFSP